MNPQQLAYWYWLDDVKGIGPTTTRKLLNQFGNPSEVFHSTKSEIVAKTGIRENLAENIEKSKSSFERYVRFAEKQTEIAAMRDANILTSADRAYHDLYSHHGGEAPLPAVIHIIGDVNLLATSKIGIVGTRNPSEEGRRRAYDLALNLAREGYTIVSGLALGIDAESHKAALATGGSTIAVLGCGADVRYPPENAPLHRDISQRGLIVSEFPFGVRPTTENLRKRNRTIAALSEGVVLAECPIRSGALIAARFAAQQKKPIFSFRYGEDVDNSGGEWLMGKALATELENTAFDTLLRAKAAYRVLDKASIEKAFLELWPKKLLSKKAKSAKPLVKEAKTPTKTPKNGSVLHKSEDREPRLAAELPSEPDAVSDGRESFAFKVGDSVVHPKFGKGEITKVVRTDNDYLITVKFSRKDVRTFSWQLSGLSRST